jgi:hypothetical protein
MDREAMETALTLMGWVPCWITRASNGFVLGITRRDVFAYAPEFGRPATEWRFDSRYTAIAEEWRAFEDWQINVIYAYALAEVNGG